MDNQTARLFVFLIFHCLWESLGRASQPSKLSKPLISVLRDGFYSNLFIFVCFQDESFLHACIGEFQKYPLFSSLFCHISPCNLIMYHIKMAYILIIHVFPYNPVMKGNPFINPCQYCVVKNIYSSGQGCILIILNSWEEVTIVWLYSTKSFILLWFKFKKIK